MLHLKLQIRPTSGPRMAIAKHTLANPDSDFLAVLDTHTDFETGKLLYKDGNGVAARHATTLQSVSRRFPSSKSSLSHKSILFKIITGFLGDDGIKRHGGLKGVIIVACGPAMTNAEAREEMIETMKR